MDQLLIDKLVTLKPVNWATTIARHEVVQKLHAKTRFSVPEMKSYAAKLDITPRYLYMLVRQYAAEVGGAPIREKTPGPGRTLDARCEKLIETTIAEIGLGATPNVIAKEVRERRSRDKLPYVSDMTVRHRISEIAGRDRLRNLFQKDCDYLLDACELGLRLKSEERGVGTAYIGGLFDIRNGTLIAHRVTFEFPDAGEITRILSFIPAAETGGDARVGITTSVSAYGDEIRRTLRAEPVSLRRGLRKGGLGFRNFFGRRLGKLDFCGERREDTTCMKPVSPAEAEQVIASIVAKYTI